MQALIPKVSLEFADLATAPLLLAISQSDPVPVFGRGLFLAPERHSIFPLGRRVVKGVTYIYCENRDSVKEVSTNYPIISCTG